MRVIQRSGQRNTWLELVIKCSRQFRKRVTVTVCNCRTLRGFQFGHAAPRICILCVLYATCILSLQLVLRNSVVNLSPSTSFAPSFSFYRSLCPFLSSLFSNVVINELRPFPWMSLWVPRFTEPAALHLWTMPERYAISFHSLVSVRPWVAVGVTMVLF